MRGWRVLVIAGMAIAAGAVAFWLLDVPAWIATVIAVGVALLTALPVALGALGPTRRYRRSEEYTAARPSFDEDDDALYATTGAPPAAAAPPAPPPPAAAAPAEERRARRRLAFPSRRRRMRARPAEDAPPTAAEPPPPEAARPPSANGGERGRRDAAAPTDRTPRWLQCSVNGGPTPKQFARSTSHTIEVWIGPREAQVVVATSKFDNGQLDWTVDKYDLTVAFVPLTPRGEPQQRPIELRQAGRSTSAEFRLATSPDDERVEARVSVLYRNRVLQTAILSARIGEDAELSDRLALRSGFGGLEHRSEFDLALVANHTESGLGVLIAHAKGATKVNDPVGLEQNTNRIRETLEGVISQRMVRRGVDTKAGRAILRDLAINGRDLYRQFATILDDEVLSAQRVQVITARDGWFLPLEFIYDREAPREDPIEVCPRYGEADASSSCDASCPHFADTDRFVCPLAFWGLSRTIERHHYDKKLATELDAQALVLGDGEGASELLSISRAAFASSNEVASASQKRVKRALGKDVFTAASWKDWRTGICAEPRCELLVLLPHTDLEIPALVIEDDELSRGQISTRDVDGDHANNHPIVLLLGCATTGDAYDSSGFASAFMFAHAAVVFTSLSKVFGVHAADMAMELTAMLREERDEPVSLGALLTQFRRKGLADGLLAALAVTAHGDADWQI
jgi:hypothetical protein